MTISRRDFIASAAPTTPAATATTEAQQTTKHDHKPAETKTATIPGSSKNVIISSFNGFAYLYRGYAKLRSGADTLDSALAVVSGPEDDPNDDSVGYGGLPNEEGVVELDSSLMHGD